MSVVGRGSIVRFALGVALLASAGAARGANDPAVTRGVQFLRSRAKGLQVGETALLALALLKADLPPSDPTVASCIAVLRSRFASGAYLPERRGGHDSYEAAVVAMALSNLSAESRRAEMDAIAQYLAGRQKANGSWDYDARVNGDTSISQYAILGLWEAETGGGNVPPQVWDRAAQWFLSSQGGNGAWTYHPDEKGVDTLSMTAAGVGSLLICQRQLARARRGPEGGTSNLLSAVGAEGERSRPKYNPSTANASINQAVQRGLAWLGSNFTTNGANTVVGQTPYYALYGIERIGALAERQALGRVDWFEQGSRMILATQRNDGAWDATHGDVVNTVWAILFITKSTAKTIKRIQLKSLGAGTLLGGRGLPKDLSNLTVAGGRVVSRPMNGAVEGMLAVLEDPRAENADSALAGLVTRYRVEGPTVLRPHKDRYRKMLSDRDPGVRKVAAWSLARTTDLDVVPSLIGALTDREESVVTVAREGLQLISRKIVGLGPPSPSSPEQRQAAAKRWSEWYSSIRPLGIEGQDEAAAPAPDDRRGPR